METKDPRQLPEILRDGGGTEGAEPLNFGQRVRDLRKGCRSTLAQASKYAGLARSTLSKIENGQMSPTYEALKKLAVGLGIFVPQLFTPPVNNQISGRIVVTKTEQGTTHATATYEHELLSDSLTKKRMIPYHSTVRSRSIEEFESWVRHNGEEFLYVLTGIVMIFTEFYELLGCDGGIVPIMMPLWDIM